MLDLVKEGLLWLAMIVPSASGIFAAVYLIIKGTKDLKEAVQTFTASKEVRELTERLDGLLKDKKTTDAENAQLHNEIRLLIDELRRVKGYADYVLGEKNDDSKV